MPFFLKFQQKFSYQEDLDIKLIDIFIWLFNILKYSTVRKIYVLIFFLLPK